MSSFGPDIASPLQVDGLSVSYRRAEVAAPEPAFGDTGDYTLTRRGRNDSWLDRGRT